MLIRLSTQYGANGTQTVNILDPGNLNHPFEVRGEDSVLDKPAGQFGPLNRVAAVDGKTRLGVLVLGILQVTGHFLVCTTCKTYGVWGMARVTYSKNWQAVSQTSESCKCLQDEYF